MWTGSLVSDLWGAWGHGECVSSQAMQPDPPSLAGTGDQWGEPLLHCLAKRNYALREPLDFPLRW